MNQVLKDCVYGKGTPRQVKFIAELGGMNTEELAMFKLLHEGHPDLYIMEELNLDRKSFMRVEEAVRAKIGIAIFHCIDVTYEFENPRAKT